MYLQNLQLEEINVAAFKAELRAEIENEPDVSEQQTEEALAQMYVEASEAMASFASDNPTDYIENIKGSFSPQLAGQNIWTRLRKFICNILKEDSTVDEIIDAILEFLSSVIPGGIIIKKLVKKVIRFILNRGYAALCPVV